jgi:hypothetical protein
MEFLLKQLADNERQHEQLLRLIKAERMREDIQAGKDLLSFFEKNLGQCKATFVNHLEDEESYTSVRSIDDESDCVFFLRKDTATWIASWSHQRQYDCEAADVKRLQEIVRKKNEKEWL